MQPVTKLKCTIKTWSLPLFNTDRSHNGNIYWIHEDRSQPFCAEWGQTIVSQKPPPSPITAPLELCLNQDISKVQDTALSIPAGWKTTAPCTRPTGHESWAGLWASSLRRPRCTKLKSNLLLLGSVVVPATGSSLQSHIWSRRPSVAGSP